MVPRPKDKNVIKTKSVYRNKLDENGKLIRNKSRLVFKGYTQIEGIYFDDTFAPMSMYSSIISMISIVVEMGWSIHRMDVRTTFLNGVLEEEVYMELPQGFEVHERESHVCRLKKALYGFETSSESLVFQD